jgi:hypothetical protein
MSKRSSSSNDINLPDYPPGSPPDNPPAVVHTTRRVLRSAASLNAPTVRCLPPPDLSANSAEASRDRTIHVRINGPYLPIAQAMCMSLKQHDDSCPGQRQFHLSSISSIDEIEVRVYVVVHGNDGNLKGFLCIKSIQLQIPTMIRQLRQTLFFEPFECESAFYSIFNFLGYVRYDKICNEFVRIPFCMQAHLSKKIFKDGLEVFSRELQLYHSHTRTHPKCMVCGDITSTKFDDHCSHAVCYVCISKNSILICPTCLLCVTRDYELGIPRVQGDVAYEFVDLFF